MNLKGGIIAQIDNKHINCKDHGQLITNTIRHVNCEIFITPID